MLTHGGAKWDYARKLAGALCYVGLVRLDTIEIQGFSGRLTQRVFSSGGRHRFSGVMDGISALEAGGATDYLRVVREFIGSYSQRGLVIVISDFLDDQSCEKALQYLTDYGHELMLLQIWADEDRVPPWTGELELRDSESGAAEASTSTKTRRRYTDSFDEYRNGLQAIALRSGGRYAGIATSQSWRASSSGPHPRPGYCMRRCMRHEHCMTYRMTWLITSMTRKDPPCIS